jgi:hypothetical protein
MHMHETRIEREEEMYATNLVYVCVCLFIYDKETI